MSKTSAAILEWLDPIALYGIQPLVAGLSIVSLRADGWAFGAMTKPFAWGSIILLQLIFAEDIWSFAVRHDGQRRLAMMWIKLVGAGICGILVFAAAYRSLGLIDQGQLSHKAGTALYFSITAWSTVGYGDVVPSPAARPFAAAQALIGVGYDSAFIGLVLYASTRKIGAGASKEDANGSPIVATKDRETLF